MHISIFAIEFRNLNALENNLERAFVILKALLIAFEVVNNLEATFEDYATIKSSQQNSVQETIFRAVSFADRECFELLVNFILIKVTCYIHEACHLGSVNVAQELLRQGIGMDISNSDDDHSLHLAAHHLHYEVLQALVANGPDISYNSKRLRAPLMAAIEGCLAKMSHSTVDCLRDGLRDKVIPSMRTKPRKYQQFTHCRLRKAMESGGRSTWGVATDDELKLAQLPTCLHKILQFLLNHEADSNPQPGVFGTALQITCFIRSETIVRLLLDNGADVNGNDG